MTNKDKEPKCDFVKGNSDLHTSPKEINRDIYTRQDKSAVLSKFGENS